MAERRSIILALAILPAIANAQTTEKSPVWAIDTSKEWMFVSTPLAASTLTISGVGKSISIDEDGKVTCPAMISEQEAADVAEQSRPYGGIYLALWRAYCPSKPLSTFERP